MKQAKIELLLIADAISKSETGSPLINHSRAEEIKRLVEGLSPDIVSLDNMLEDYKDLQDNIFNYFGYRESAKALAIDDSRSYFWRIHFIAFGSIEYALEKDTIINQDDTKRYEDAALFLHDQSDWAFRGPEFTMVLVDTHSEVGELIRIFDNSKEVK